MRRLTILVVCRANYCRSPLVEHLLRAAADHAQLPWTVSSAGTHAAPGLPCHPSTARVLAERGIETSGFVTRLLVPEQIHAADLILTAGPEQRQQVVALSADAVPRTFPLLTFATWLSHDPAGPDDGDGDLVAAALRGRSRSQPISLAAQTLRDPLGRRIRWFRRCAGEIDQAVAAIVSRGTAGSSSADPASLGQLP